MISFKCKTVNELPAGLIKADEKLVLDIVGDEPRSRPLFAVFIRIRLKCGAIDLDSQLFHLSASLSEAEAAVRVARGTKWIGHIDSIIFNSQITADEDDHLQVA